MSDIFKPRVWKKATDQAELVLEEMEIEDIRTAYIQGYYAGYQHGETDAYDEGFVDGFSQGHDAATKEVRESRAEVLTSDADRWEPEGDLGNDEKYAKPTKRKD